MHLLRFGDILAINSKCQVLSVYWLSGHVLFLLTIIYCGINLFCCYWFSFFLHFISFLEVYFRSASRGRTILTIQGLETPRVHFTDESLKMDEVAFFFWDSFYIGFQGSPWGTGKRSIASNWILSSAASVSLVYLFVSFVLFLQHWTPWEFLHCNSIVASCRGRFPSCHHYRCCFELWI